MTNIFKTYPNNPPHLFIANAKYFITGATLWKIHYITGDDVKYKKLEYMFKSFDHYGWTIEDWVLLENHYHVMSNAPENAETLFQVINNFHRFRALWIKKHVSFAAKAKRIWWNYWDTCMTFERSYFARLHYLWINPVHHNCVKQPEEYKFCSYYHRLDEEEYLKRIMRDYPCDNLDIEDDF